MADPATCLPLERDSISAAHDLIRDLVHKTPVLTCQALNDIASTTRTPDGLARTQWASMRPAKPVFRFWFKCENLQRAGTFKVRGAFHALERLRREPGWLENGGLEKGVVAHSAGNHSQALALAAGTMGMPVHIVMPKIANKTKVAATCGYGAEVIWSGSNGDEREKVAAQVAADTGGRLVPPYDHPDIILGQGTVGLELQQQVAELLPQGRSLDAVIAPCGGGGLLSGVALSCDGTGIRVYGGEPSYAGANDVCMGFGTGKRITKVSSRTVADCLRTPIGVLNWQVCYERRLVAGMYSVKDAEIMLAAKLIMERMKMMVEPSAAVPLAIALFDEDFRGMVEKEAGEKGWDVGIIISGGNVDLSLLSDQLATSSEVGL